MKVTIWDLDYYYAENKTNCFNPDAMKISSYHKQLGDVVNFVEKQDDIYRPYDLYYIIRDKKTTPQPPSSFFLNEKVRWWGKASRARIRWKMSDAMLACRSDYLLYPNHDTKIERSEHIRLFNNNAELLPVIQNWKNTYKNKYTIVTDPCMWYSDIDSISSALDMLLEVKKVSFLEPIWLQKLISNKEIKDKFLKLKFSPGSKITWTEIKLSESAAAINFIKEFQTHYPRVRADAILIDYREKERSHWENKNFAIEDLISLMELICRCKKEGVKIEIKMPVDRLNSSPYFFIFEEIARWTQKCFHKSWLEYLSSRFSANRDVDAETYWRSPSKWDVNFRDLIRQTWKNKDFLLIKWKDKRISETEVPWQVWEKEFEYGI